MAGNWTLDGTMVERLEADTNLRLADDGDGALFGSVSGVDLELGHDTPRTRLELGSGLRFRRYVGPGDTDGLQGFSDPRLEGAITHRGKRQELTADFDILQRPTAFTQVDETGLTESEATETRLQAGGGWTWRPDPLDTLSLRADTDIRRFSEDADAFAPSTGWTVTGRWGRLVDPRSEAGATLQFRRFEADGALAETRTSVVTLGADFVRRPTKRHRLSLAAGVGRAWTEETGALGPGSSDRDESSLHLTADLGFDWQGPGGVTVALAASRSLEPTAAGALQDTTRLDALLGRQMTRRSRLAMDAAYVQRRSDDSLGGAGDDSRFLRFGPRLDVELTRNWDAGLGLDLRLRDNDDGTARSARLFFEIRRDFVLDR